MLNAPWGVRGGGGGKKGGLRGLGGKHIHTLGGQGHDLEAVITLQNY